MASKPIRVFYSTLSGRFYATSRYKEKENGDVVITGKKYDVTQDIARAIDRYKITFTPVENE